MNFILGLNALMALLGYLLPMPCIILAWLRWNTNRKPLSAQTWRRRMTGIVTLTLTLGTAFWAYVILRDVLRHDYLYGDPTAVAARWSLPGLFIVSLAAESKARPYLLLGAIGLWFFFISSIGDVWI